ncbi:MAG: hypothetical protein Q7T18_11835 [Sedimentisphaerales bacterium]|nr:hypothetical protein [Sedimentisphaerales bacterium]
MTHQLHRIEYGKKYIVVKAFEDNCDPRWKLKSQCYSLSIGDVLTSRGRNLNNVEFTTRDGKLIILSPRIAFKIMENYESTTPPR